MPERRFTLVDFTHSSKTGRLRLYEAGHTYSLPRALAHAATKRVAKPTAAALDSAEHIPTAGSAERGRGDRGGSRIESLAASCHDLRAMRLQVLSAGG